jgi:hypothetical protein
VLAEKIFQYLSAASGKFITGCVNFPVSDPRLEKLPIQLGGFTHLTEFHSALARIWQVL